MQDSRCRTGDRPVSSDQLVDALWISAARAPAHKRAQVAISRLRKALAAGAAGGDEALQTVAGGYLLAVPADELDAALFCALADEGHRSLDRGESNAAADILTKALALWRGPPYAQVTYADFAQPEIRRLEELRLAALEARVEAHLRLGRHATVIAELEALVGDHPGRERLAGQLMLALYRCGRQSDALDVYQRTRVRLAGQLGLEPGPALKELQTQVLRQSPQLDTIARQSAPAEEAALAPFALPGVLSGPTLGPFVGRQSDFRRLRDLYEQADSGSCCVVLIRGEPGVGKTRLATELALVAHSAGAVALYGRCDEESLVPHQPFVEALRHYVASCPIAQLTGQLGSNGGELRRLVPELAGRVQTLADPLPGDPEGARYRLFEAVVGLLVAAARARPVVLVLDDLHWADRPTMLLLTHLLRHSRGARLLVIGTYRDSELEPGHPLSETLALLSREQRLERHSLAPLDEDAVASLVRGHTGQEAPELAKTIFTDTDGNPFFVVEMLRHLAESTPGERSVPEGVKDVIARRVARLGPRAEGLLSLASVSGRDFNFAVLYDVSDLDEDELVEALEQALRARLIEEVATSAGRYTFSHALIREAIYGGLTATRRRLIHRRLAASIEQAYAGDLEPHRAALALHFAQAGSAADLEKAIEHGVLAGDRAAAQLAHEQAATHYRNVVSLIDATDDPRQQQRCDLVIAQGEAERRAGDAAYRDTLLEGARIAQRLADRSLLARAALANNRGFFSAPGGVDRERVGVLEAALEAQGSGDTSTRAILLAQLAAELVADPDWRRRIRLSDDALAMARRIADPATLLNTLNYRYAALMGPRTLAERLSNCHEADQLARRLGDPVHAFHAAHGGSNVALEAGDLALSDAMLQREGELATRLGQPIMIWFAAMDRAKRSCVTGEPSQAAKLAHEALVLGRSAGQPDAFGWYHNQLVVLRFLQGAFGSGRPDLVAAADQARRYDARGQPTGNSSLPVLIEAMHLLALCEVGRCEDARPRFNELMRNDPANLAHDWSTLTIGAMASIACAHLDDAAHAEQLYAMLAPDADHFICTGPCWFGATTHHMALLAGTMRRYAEADDLFAETVDAYASLGATAWQARVKLDWARSLVARHTCDSQHVMQLLDQTTAAASELDLPGVARQAAALLEATHR